MSNSNETLQLHKVYHKNTTVMFLLKELGEKSCIKRDL